MKTELQTVQDIPLCLRECSVTPYRDHFAVCGREAGSCLFVDSEELSLIEALKAQATIAGLLRLHHDRYGGYSYKKVFDLIFQVMRRSLLTAESESALRQYSIFKTAPESFAGPAAIPHAIERVGRLAGPAGRYLDAPAAIGCMFALTLFSIYILAAEFPDVGVLAAGTGYARGLAVWVASFAAVIFIQQALKYVLLLGKGLAVSRTMPYWLGLRKGFPRLAVDDSRIVVLGWGKTLTFHLASLLFPSIAAGLAILLNAIHPTPIAGVFILASLLILFLDLSPFVNGELLKALDRLSGKYSLIDVLHSFVHRKFASRMFSFRSTFQFEIHLLGYGVFAVLWMYGGYRLVDSALQLNLGRLTDAIILSDLWSERLAAAALLCAVLFPLLLLLGGIVRLAAVNFYSLFEKPLDRIRNRIIFMIRAMGKTPPAEVMTFLESIPLFAGIPPESRAKLAEYVQVEVFAGHRTVVWKGEEGDAFYVIYSGEADVLQEEESGARAVVARLSSGDSFGEIALLENSPRTATVRARTPLVCFVLRAFFFKRFIADQPGLRDHITKLIRLSAFLKEMPMFSDVPPEAINRVILEIRERDVPKGGVILKEGDPADEFYILRSGSAAVFKNGKEMAALSAGEYFGEIALFEDTPRTATVTARESCSLLVMPKDSFFRILRTSVLSGLAVEESTRTRKRELEHQP